MDGAAILDYPIDAVRARFPALQPEGGERPPIFFDAPAGAQTPRSVIEAVGAAMIEAASHRGGPFAASRRAEEIWLEAHRAAADFVGGDAEEIVIGPSTAALAFAVGGALGRAFRPGEEIVVTSMDRECDIAPWLRLARDRELVVKWLDPSPSSQRIETAALEAKLTDRTRLVAFTGCSHFTGAFNPVAELAAAARAAGAIAWLDAAQWAPHRPIDVAASGCDVVLYASHAICGPHLGALWGRKALLETIEADRRRAPETGSARFEIGEPQTELLAGFAAAIDHWAWLGETAAGAIGDRRTRILAGHAAVGAWERSIGARLLQGLRDLPGVEILGPADVREMALRAPTIAFTPGRGEAPSAIVAALAAEGVCASSGPRDAFETARRLGLGPDEGAVQLGLSHYNTEAEVDAALSVLELRSRAAA